MNYDRSDSREAPASGEGTGSRKESQGEVEDPSKDDLVSESSSEKKEKSEKHNFVAEQDPLIESILTLQSVQEALEKEVQRFGKVGKDFTSVPSPPSDEDGLPVDLTSIEPESRELNPNTQMGSEKVTNPTGSLADQVIGLRENIQLLGSKLEETEDMLRTKESRISDLEAAMNRFNLPKEECGVTTDLKQSSETETEVDSLFRQRIEAEVECLAITMTIDRMRVAVTDHRQLVKQQHALAGEQMQVVHKLGKAESKAGVLTREAQKLEKYYEDIMGTERVLKMQRKVCKACSYFFIQLSLLVYIWLFILQSMPPSRVIVPT